MRVSQYRAELMERMDRLEELLGKEKLLDEILMGMSTDELKDNVEWIENNYDIRSYEEEEEFA